MGNRHGGERSAAQKEDKEERKRKKKEKKAAAKKRQQKKKAGGTVLVVGASSDVDLDPESSQFSRADSESLVFHSAENLSPYLDASTRSEEGAACGGFYDNGHILSSKDFHDGFSLEACLPADLAAVASPDVNLADVTNVGDDVTSMSSGVYGTPLLSSPDVRRGIPRSPLAARQKDSFVEPVPPIPSDFSSNTLSSVSYQEGVSTPGTQRSSSRASSSTVDTNAAHCIERLEELERNIERTIIEKFAPVEQQHAADPPSENTTPRLARRDFRDEGGSREGSVTPKGLSSDGILTQSPQTTPTVVRKISEPCRPTVQREGSSTPQGIVHGMWSQSAESSPVIVRKALPSPESPIILRRTPSQSPSVERKFPANAPESPVFYRRAVNAVESPALSPSIQRRVPADSQEKSLQLIRREAPELDHPGAATTQKKKIPPPVPPKPVMKTLTSPEIARRLQNMPKSPIMARKVYAFQDQQTKDNTSAIPRDNPWERSWREHQMPPRSPSRSPEVRHRVPRKTPSSSPSPKSLVRKLMPQEDRAPPPPVVGTASSPLTQIQFCQQQKGIPVQHCTVAAQPSAAVVLNMGPGPHSCHDSTSPTPTHGEQSHDVHPPGQDNGSENAARGTVSEDSIRKSTESAVFGSVSPKLKRQRRILSGDDGSYSSSFDHQRGGGDSTDSSTRSPPCSPPIQRSRPFLSHTKDSQGELGPSSMDLQGDHSPVRRRAHFPKQTSKSREESTLSADIAGGLTYHGHIPSDDVTSGPRGGPGLASVQYEEGGDHPILHQEMDRMGQQGRPFLDKRGVEGQHDRTSGESTTATTTTTGTHVSHTTDQPPSQAPPPPPRDNTTIATTTTERSRPHLPQHSALITGSAVTGKGARDLASAAGLNTAGDREQQHTTVITARKEGEGGEEGEETGAWWRREERGVRQQQQQQQARVATVPASCQRVPSPPPPCTAGTVSGSSSSGSGVGGDGGGAAKPASKNLGQRIRDVIFHESAATTFREVFTAELSSSSSVEREDGGTYTSDDNSVIGTGGGDAHGRAPSRSLHPHPYWHHPPPPPERKTPSHPPSLSPSSSPTTPRATAVQGECVTRGGREFSQPESSNPTQQSLPALSDHPVTVPLQYHPASPVDTTAIRRIDIDVNVVLPHGAEIQEGVSAAACADQPNLPVSGQFETDWGQGVGITTEGETMETGTGPDQDIQHSSPVYSGERGAKTVTDKHDRQTEEVSTAEPIAPPTTLQEKTTQSLPVMEQTPGEQTAPSGEAVKNASDYNKKGDKHSEEAMRMPDSAAAPPVSLPVTSAAQGFQNSSELSSAHRERSAEGEEDKSKGAVSCFAPESESGGDQAGSVGPQRQSKHEVNINTDPAQPTAPLDQSVSVVHSSHPLLSSPVTTTTRERTQDPQAQAHDTQHQNGQPTGAPVTQAQHTMADVQQPEPSLHEDNVPPPSPTAMDTLAEEEEEEEEEGEDVNCMLNAHHDSDISSKISQEMQLFGETVVKRLSSLLESQASESDSCLEESRTDLLTVPATRHRTLEEGQGGKLSSPDSQSHTDSSSKVNKSEGVVGADAAGMIDHHLKDEADSDHKTVAGETSENGKGDTEPVLHEELNTFATSDLPGERLVTSDTTETLSTDHDTSASSKRESTASTATDETLTSFKTRSTTDSAEFEDAFILPESLVFVRSVNDDREGERAVVESGRIIKRPPIPAELTRHVTAASASETTLQHKPRKKRRRQIGSFDVSARTDVIEPEPKRGSKQIQEVIDAYCEEMGSSDDSDISSSSTDDILKDELAYKTTFSRSEQQPRLPSSLEREDRVKDIVRKPKPPADRSTDSSDESGDLGAKRQSSSSHDSSFRIPEIEETFGELMGVKTFLEDLEDKTTPTSELPPVSEEKAQAKECGTSAPHQHRRRSKTSPARTDRTESDLDVSEHRDDASTDSMYADDEDEGAELVFQRSYSEEHGGEVVLSCTIYNSAHDNDADSDDFWADSEAAAAAAADSSYKSLETAADAAGSAFQNARIQMHDIHQHLQDLRRQMELLQDDITSTSLTLTPEFSLESEQRPVTE